jgi:hypothetical protein
MYRFELRIEGIKIFVSAVVNHDQLHPQDGYKRKDSFTDHLLRTTFKEVFLHNVRDYRIKRPTITKKYWVNLEIIRMMNKLLLLMEN